MDFEVTNDGTAVWVNNETGLKEDDDLVAYAMIHSRTELALFSAEDCRRLYQMAGMRVYYMLRHSNGFHRIDADQMEEIKRLVDARKVGSK